MRPLRVTAFVGLCALCSVACSSETKTGVTPDAAVPAPDVAPASVTVPDAAAADTSEPRDLGTVERTPTPAAPVGHGWALADVGEVMNKGAFATSSSLFTLRGGGTTVGGASDSFAFAFRKMKGDGDIIARVRSVQMMDPGTIAGVMFRADETDPSAASVLLGVLGDTTKGGQSVVRAAKGAAAVTSAPDAFVKAGQFLKIRREGKLFSLYRSADRTAWIKLGVVEAQMPEEVAVGLAVSSHTAASVAAAEFDFVGHIASDAAAQGWDLELLSGIGPSAVLKQNQLTITAVGDPFTTTTEFGAGVLRPMTGSQVLVAQVESISENAPGGRVALIYREGGPARLSPTARNVLVSVTNAGVVQFQRRDKGTNFEAGKMMMGMKPPLWLKLARTDDPVTWKTKVTASISKDGMAWTDVDAAEIPLSDPVMGGALVTSGDSKVFATARLGNFPGGGSPAPPPDAGIDAGATDAAEDTAGVPIDAGGAATDDAGAGN